MLPHTSQLENCTFLSNTIGIFVKSDQVTEQHLTNIMDYPSNSGASRDTGSALGWKDALEEEMATHSSILARRIPWIEAMGLQRGGHN